VADRIRFFFDPRCPWCYQTSRWVGRLAELGEVAVTWGVFSLEVANADGDVSTMGTKGAGPALRTVLSIRDSEGHDAVGRFYAALGAAVHQRGEAVDDRAVIERSLDEAGLPTALLDKALGDHSTWGRVVAEHQALVERTRSFGVPTIALDDGDGPAIFGPVISEVPTDADAVELWRHVAWLARYENFSELKRDRTIQPDLMSVRKR
jgi:2-hydroxychromene-2-carboxylate isomerase